MKKDNKHQLTMEEFEFMKKQIDDHEKYFVPELSDLYVGYECYKYQYRDEETGIEYLSHIIEEDDFVDARLVKKLKTPFLSKEQIEKEGWKYIEDDMYGRKLYTHYMDNGHILPGHDTSTYTMKYSLNSRPNLEIERQNNSSWNNDKDKIFQGACKSLNEFRKIIKWIGI